MKDHSTADVHADVLVSAASTGENTARIEVKMLGRPSGPRPDYWAEDPELTVTFSPSPVVSSVSLMQRSRATTLVAADGRSVPEGGDARVPTGAWTGTDHSWVSFDPLTPGRLTQASIVVSIDPLLFQKSSADVASVQLGSVVVRHDVSDQQSGFPDALSATFEVFARSEASGVRILVGCPEYSLHIEWAEDPMQSGWAVTKVRSEAGLGGCHHTVCMGDEFPFEA